jgi:hypothetical protein
MGLGLAIVGQQVAAPHKLAETGYGIFISGPPAKRVDIL